LSDAFLERLVPLVRQRISRLDEFVAMTDFFFAGDLDYGPLTDDLLARRAGAEVAQCLLGLVEALDAQRDFSPDALEALARAYAARLGWDVKELFMLIRMAASGRKATPPLFATLSALGRDIVRRRLRLCGEYLKRLPPAPTKKHE
jgi:glutamyl-tRNA synthetase